MDRLLVVRCPDLLVEDEGGAALRTFAGVLAAVEAYCPWVTPVPPASARCPSGARPATSVGRRPWSTWSMRPHRVSPAEVGIADGLFAAVLAARQGEVVPAGGQVRSWPRCRWASSASPSWPSCSTAWASAHWASSPRSPSADILGRFGADGARGHRVAGGRNGELADLRQPRLARLLAGDDAPDARWWPKSGSGAG